MKKQIVLTTLLIFFVLCGFKFQDGSGVIYHDKGIIFNNVVVDELDLTPQERYELRAIAESEARNQGIKGMALVMRVVLNRYEYGGYGEDIHSVIFAYKQFHTPGMPSYDHLSKESELALMWVINGWDESEGALYFCADGYNGPIHLFKYGDHWFSRKDEIMVIKRSAE